MIVAAIVLAWCNSLRGPFVFDDLGSVPDNRTIRHLWPADWAHPPAGETVSGRPVLNFSFALNYAAGGPSVAGYHVVNLVIHALAALTLFGLVRRTLALRPWPALGSDPARATALAAAVALLWGVHPLQVESVTYVVQRAESLAGLFCLLTLYGFCRGVQETRRSPTSGRAEPARRSGSTKLWFGIAIASCLLGIGTKETVVVMPVIVLLYDWVFGAGSWRGVWTARRGVHALLLLTWLPLAFLVLGAGGDRGGAFAFTPDAIGHYWVAQWKAVTCYLGLVVWPAPLVFDRAFFRLGSVAEAAPYALVIVVLLGLTARALRRRSVTGFLGAAFFLLLAPTSLMPGLLQVTVEHRMYLALAAPVILLVALAWRAGPRYAGLLVPVAMVALGTTTFQRNHVYQSGLSLWEDTVRKSPDNSRAHYNLGVALRAAGREGEAVAEFQRTLELKPNHAFALFELGKGELQAARWEEAARYFAAAIEADEHYVAARLNLGVALGALGRPTEAIVQYQAALADDPTASDIRTNLGGLLVEEGRVGEGEVLLREALAADPNLAEAHFHLGIARLRAGAVAEAETELRAAVGMKSDSGAADAWFALGNLLARQERLGEAAVAFRSALERNPGHLLARASLANCQLMAGQLDEAIANYEAVLRVRPGDRAVQGNLELAREQKRSGR